MDNDTKITISAIIAITVVIMILITAVEHNKGLDTDCRTVALIQNYPAEQIKEVCGK